MTRTRRPRRRMLPEKLRWHIAYLLNRLPGQCWADLVCWVQYRSHPRSPWSPIDRACRNDRDRTGTCYCGKLGGRREPGEVER
jgi:hypothetical protein